ncbi:MAG: SRPBCC family protein [Methylocystis sp.]
MRATFFKKLVVAVLFLLPPCAAYAAHGASPLKVVEEIKVDASLEKVWGVISDFVHPISKLPIDRIEISGADAPDQSERRLILKNGFEIIELLTKRDRERLMIGVHRKTDNIQLLPAVNYTSLITLRSLDQDHTIIEWKARFYRGYPNNNPPPELNDDVAVAAVKKLIIGELDALKNYLEKPAGQ